jgi:hypothetical protein
MGCAAPPPASPIATTPRSTATPSPTVTPPAPQPCPAYSAHNFDSAATLALQSPAQPALRLCPIELAIHLGIDIVNPYDPEEIDLRMTFTSPSGEETQVPAFWTLHQSDPKQSGWRVRFTPAVAGDWRAAATAITAQAAFTSNAITFTVSPRSAPGFVRLHPANPRYLAFDAGATFFPIGVNLAWWRDDAMRDYTRWLDALHANGANAARVWMASWAFGIEWSDTGIGNYNNRQHRAHWLDEVFRMAEQRGIYLVISLLPDRDFRDDEVGHWRDNPYNAANGGMAQRPQAFVSDERAKSMFKRRLRYIAARWGYSPNLLAWEWWNEAELTRIETPALMPWLKEMTAHLRQFDVNHHLVTTSYAGNGDDDVWRMPEIDLMQRHEYSEAPKWFKPIEGGFRLTPNAPAKPLLFGEFGYSPHGETPDPASALGIHLRNALWASAFNGFASTAMYWWWDTLIDPAQLWPAFKGISTFLRNEDVATYRAAPAISSTPKAIAMALRQDERALLWLRNAQFDQSNANYKRLMSESTGERFDFTLDPLSDVRVQINGLHDGTYRVQWSDPASGAAIAEMQVVAQGGRLIVQAPAFTSDITAKVTPSCCKPASSASFTCNWKSATFSEYTKCGLTIMAESCAAGSGTMM